MRLHWFIAVRLHPLVLVCVFLIAPMLLVVIGLHLLALLLAAVGFQH